ncbi:MAG: hypothetical protein CMP81_21750 [Fulvimarina sp.]|nr:hypothetical protein [Fulvimarina sp.]
MLLRRTSLAPPYSPTPPERRVPSANGWPAGPASSPSSTSPFHYVMVGGMVSAFFAGLHFWWPKITGRLYPEVAAQIAALLMFSWRRL